MAKLPFVVEPRLKPRQEEIGSDNSGKILVERRGYLAAGEKAFVTTGTQSDSVSELMLGLVRKIATKFRLDMKEAYEFASQVISGNPEDAEMAAKVRVEFAEELTDVITAAIDSQARTSFIKAYCILLYRVDPEITADDCLGLHPDLIEGLALLYDEEDAKSVERLLDAVEAEADTEDTQTEAIDEIAKK